MSYSKDQPQNDIVRDVQRTSEEEELARLKVQVECDKHNESLNDRAAKRRAARDLKRTGKTPSLRLPFSRNRALRRHPAPELSFEPDPNAQWRGRRMFLQRDKNRAEGRV